MGKGIFVTGTGTDVGKTYVTGLIIKKLKENGMNPGYFKAAMSGNERREDGSIIPGDALWVKETSGIEQPLEEMCPYVYEHAYSPHLASKIEGNPVVLSVVMDGFRKLKEQYDYITVEGSGGILCPICFDEARIGLQDVINAMGLDCILVADAGLGTINSVVLTYEYMKNSNMNIKGVIFNNYIASDVMHEDNIRMCEYMTGLPTCGAIEGGKPQESWPEINWPGNHQRPVITGGAIEGEWPEINWPGIHQKPVTTGGAIDAYQPNKGNGENQKPTTPDNSKDNETQKPTTPDNGKNNEAQNPTTPDNGKGNAAGQKPENGATDSNKQPATTTEGAVKAQDQNAKDANNEQKPAENTVPADTASNSAIKSTKTKKKKEKIKVPAASKKMKKGKKYKIKYSVVSGSGKVTFKSSNKKVATVNAKGVVTTKKKETAIITVKIANGNTKKVKITVK